MTVRPPARPAAPRSSRWLTWLLLGWLAACVRAPVIPQPPHGSPPRIAWRPFGPEALEEARREHKLILLSVQAGFCHWCHVMNATTYQDPRVAAAVSRGFVAMRVDQDENPELRQRYLAWGWPATAILTSEAQAIVTLRGHQSAPSFARLLDELLSHVHEGRAPRVPEPNSDADSHLVGDLEPIRTFALAQLDQYYDRTQGGWGGPQKYPLSAPVQHALFRFAVQREPERLEQALTSLRGHVALIDPIDGGMFQYSLRGVWTRPHFEKLARIQADALLDFSAAYAATGDTRWREAAERVANYVVSTLQSPSGAFYASQAADVGTPGEPHHMAGERFHALTAAERRGVPAPDLGSARVRGPQRHADPRVV
ncbi:MAG: DUF255 domain-containing protein [Myxococcales bacterium]